MNAIAHLYNGKTSTSKRFHIEDTILWNVLDEQNQRCGQAAVCFNHKFITRLIER